MADAQDRAASRVGLAVATVAALVQLAPVLGRGYVLVQDMVFVPRQPWGRGLLGVTQVPRQVPSDALVAVTSRLVPAWLVQDVLLTAVFVLAGWGAARLVPGGSRVAAAVAAAVVAWCPWSAERLLLGQWALLLGYAALPWAIHAVLQEERRQVAAWLLLAGLGGAASETVVVLACLVVALATGARRFAGRIVVLAVLLAVPWALPAALLPAGVPSSGTGVTAFAARADTPFGTWASVLSLGGIWDRGVVPVSRDTWFGGLLALVVAAVAVVVLVRRRDPTSRGLLSAAAVGWLLAVGSATPGLRVVLRQAVVHLPGGGLLRDAQKWSMPLVPAVAVGAGLAVAAAVDLLRQRSPRVAAGAVVLATLVPAAALPGLAWGSDGRLRAVEWPSDWGRVRQVLAADPRPGAVAVLPWAAYRTFPWNGDRLQADPATRWLPRRAAVDDRLVVGRAGGGQLVVPGEDPWDAQVTSALAAPGAVAGRLEALGIGWVLVERTTPGSLPRLPGASVAFRGPELALLRLPGTPSPLTRVASADPAPFPGVLAADLLVLVAYLGWLAVARSGEGPRRRLPVSWTSWA